MPKPAITYDWSAITRSFEFNALGRDTKETATYFHPLTYGPEQPAPSPEHQQLSDLLVALRPLIKLPRPDWQADTGERIAALQERIEQVKRRIWVIQTEGPARPASATPLFD